MEERYWFRHPSLAGDIGPLTRSELRDALRADSLPRDGMVLRDDGGDAAARAAATWSPVVELLGLPAAPPPASRHPTAPRRTPVNSPPRFTAFLLDRRRETVYSGLRILIELTTIAVFVALLFALATSPRLDGTHFATALLVTLVYALVVLVLRGLANAVLDLADHALRAEHRNSDRDGES